MDSYYSDLAILKLNEASKAIVEGIAYAQDANAPTWLLNNLHRINSNIKNRIKDILSLRKNKPYETP